MAKNTVITNKAGKIIGSATTGKAQGVQFGVVPLSGQKLHEVEVPAEIAKTESPSDLLKGLGKLIKKK